MANQKGHKKKEIKTDPASFEGKGLFFTAKFIGVSDVADFRGNAMCQETMQKLKAAVKSSGKHKLKILVNISLEGIKLIEEKTMAVNYEHIVSRISFISIDTTDSRAFGYVFEPGDGTHKFFAIKTEKSAGHVIIAIRDLFETVFEMKKKERDEAAQKETEGKVKAAVTGEGENSAVDAATTATAAVTATAAAATGTAGKTKTEDTDNVYSGMESMGTALEGFEDFPFGHVTTVDLADPWNVNNTKLSTDSTPPPSTTTTTTTTAAAASVVLLPPPPASPRVPVGVTTAPVPPSSLFPASTDFTSNVPAEPFPPLPVATSPVTTTLEPAASMTCTLPIVSDPFGDNLFVSPSQTPFTAPTPASNTASFDAFPEMMPPTNSSTTFPAATQNIAPQQPFAAFPPEPAFPAAVQQSPFAAFPVKSQTPVPAFSIGQQPSFAAFPESAPPTAALAISSSDSSQRSTPSKFDAISLDSSFTSVFSQQSNEKLERAGSLSANSKSSDAGPNVHTESLFQELCNFGSNQHHKKPAELFPKVEVPPSKKLNELLEESMKTKEQSMQSSSKVESPPPLEGQQTRNINFVNKDNQASEHSVTPPSDPTFFPEPTEFDQTPVSAASSPDSHPSSSITQPHSDSPSIFSFSRNNPTEVTRAMAKLEFSDQMEFIHPNPPSHPPPNLPAHLMTSGVNSGSESVCSISPFPDERWVMSDEEFNLPSPTVPPPPLPTNASLNIGPDQAPTPPPRPRTSTKPPPLPVRPKQTLSSSSSLQSVGKSGSPVSSVVSLEGTVLAQHRSTSGCSFTSLHDVSTQSLPVTKFTDTKVHITKTTDHRSSISSPVSVATGNSSPPSWTAFNDNDISSSPFSNQSFASSHDAFVSQTGAQASGSQDHDWPDNNPFMSSVSPSVRNSFSPDPFSSPYTKIVDKRSKQSAYTPRSSSSSVSVESHNKCGEPAFDSVDPFCVNTGIKPPSNPNQANKNIPSSFCAASNVDSTIDPFVVPLHLKFQTAKPVVDPFVIQTNINPAQNNTQTTPPTSFFSSSANSSKADPFSHNTLNAKSDPFTHNPLNTKSDSFSHNTLNSKSDPFASFSHNTSASVQPDPFCFPSQNPAEYTRGQSSDPFTAFNQWPDASKFGMDVDKTNGH
ncbi:disabled homolog 1-like isoform X3 [Argonauta hians]